nr:structural protein E2 [Border disease virus]
QFACREDYRYALARTKEIGALGAESLTTTWTDYRGNLELDDGTVRATCSRGFFRFRGHCMIGPRYLASLHLRALPTSVTFELIPGGSAMTEEEMGDDFEFGLCPCDSRPVVKGKYNTTLLNGSAFQLICPYGWVGRVECTTVSKSTLATEVVKIYKKTKPFPQRVGCDHTTVYKQDLYHCQMGGNWTCMRGEVVKYVGGPVKKCEWCGYVFKKREGLPHYPIGRCMLRNETGYRSVDDTPCDRGGVVISKTGELECLIGKTTVKVFSSDKKLGPMPCRPKEVISSEGPVSKIACTFNYSKTLENKYYEPRDSYFQQYMLKGQYQYWFDLEATDHHSDYFAEFIMLAVVALLGGRYVLWLMVVYMILADQMTSA